MPQNSHSFKEITDIVVSKCKVYNIGRDSGWTLKEESGGLVLSTKGGNIRIFLDGDYIEFHGSGKFSSFSEFVNNDLWYMQWYCSGAEQKNKNDEISAQKNKIGKIIKK